MKNLIKLMPLMALAMFVNQTQAQWTTTGSVVAPTTLTNNVSIGTTKYGANLYVEKYNSVTMGIKSSISSAKMFMDKGDPNSSAQFDYRNYGNTIWSSGMVQSNNFIIQNGTKSTAPIVVFVTNDNISLCGDGGKVGIGTFTPNYKFEVATSEYDPALLRNTGSGNDKTCLLGIRNGNTSTVQWFQGVGGTGNAWGLNKGQYYIEHYNTTSAPKMVIDTSGKMGVGTLSPLAKLHVVSNVKEAARFDGGNQSYISIHESGIFRAYMGSFSGAAEDADFGTPAFAPGKVHLTTKAIPRLTVDNAGLVGIGTQSPLAKLHVVGDLRITNKTLTDDGSFGLVMNADPLPSFDNAFYCGNASNRWVEVWAVNGMVQTSDARLKKDIKNLPYGLNEVMKLQPVSYKWNDEKLGDDNNLGFLAQDLQKVIKEVVVDHTTRFNPEINKMETTQNDKLGVKYAELIPVLVKAIQEQQAQITMQNVKLETVIGENSELKNCIDQLCANNTAKASSPAISANALFQNQPNPFNQTTIIRFALSAEVKTANIVIRNLNGEQLKVIALNQTGKGQVTINANELAQGTYTYTLIVNGESVDTKLMVVTK